MPSFSSMESLPSFTFASPGDAVDITIDEDPREVETKYGPRIVLSGTSGADTTATVRGDDDVTRVPDVGERCSVFLKTSGAQGGAIATALRTAGVAANTDQLVVGSRLRVKFTEQVPSGKGNPTKLFSAKFDPAPKTAGAAIGGAEDWS